LPRFGRIGALSGAALACVAAVVVPPQRPVTVVAVGDVLLDRGVGERIERSGKDALVEAVLPFTRGADLAVCNLECPLASGSPSALKPIVFGGPPAGARWLREAGFDAASLANNHALDQGRAGLLQTMAALDREGVAYFGAGATQAEACRARIVRCNGRRLALLGFTVFPDEGAFFDLRHAGTARADPQAVRRAVHQARARADVVIVAFHWGREYQALTSPAQRELARVAIDAGADLVVGHHPHVIQGAQLYRGRLIAYSLGNFIFDQHRRGADRALALRVTFVGDEAAATFAPVQIADCFPRKPDDEAAQSILAHFRTLCEGLGTRVAVNGGAATVSFATRGHRDGADDY